MINISDYFINSILREKNIFLKIQVEIANVSKLIIVFKRYLVKPPDFIFTII